MTATRRNPVSSTKVVKPPAPMVRPANSSFLVQCLVYFSRHMQSALLSLGQLSKTPYTTLLITLVIGIALALPGSLFLLLDNFKSLQQQWHNPAAIALYLKTDISPDAANALLREITARPEIESVQYIPKSEGLAAFQKQSGLGQVLDNLQDNPLPNVLMVTPKDSWQTPVRMEALQNALKQMPEVDIAQLDLQWVKRLGALLALGAQCTYILAGLLCLGVIFILGSTIHLATQNRREEIFVYQMIGASKRFIRRPFLYAGIWYGLFGSMIAWVFITTTFSLLRKPTATLSTMYGSEFNVHLLPFAATAILLISGVVLGWIGSWCAIYRFLRKPR